MPITKLTKKFLLSAISGTGRTTQNIGNSIIKKTKIEFLHIKSNIKKKTKRALRNTKSNITKPKKKS